MFKFKHTLVSCLCMGLVMGCATINSGSEYSSVNQERSSSDLVVPPGMSLPDDAGANYKMVAGDNTEGYKLSQIKNMKIVQAGSERWLVVYNKKVDNLWPTMLAYLNRQGLNVKYKNQSIGTIQTDWATKNNAVSQTNQGIRGLFGLIGWSSMYSMPSQFMFRVTLWQDGDNVNIFVTEYQMNEVYPDCKMPHNSALETSDKTNTRWMAMPPNPQIELNFLLQFMGFIGLSTEEVKQQAAQITAGTSAEGTAKQAEAYLSGDNLVLNDQFDRAWWRVGLVLGRIGLGVADQNRSAGEYDLYPLKSELNTPQEGIFSKWFGNSAGQSIKLPTAQYVAILTANGEKTTLVMTPSATNTDKNSSKKIKQYLKQMVEQLK